MTATDTNSTLIDSFGIVLTEQWNVLPLDDVPHQEFRTNIHTRLRREEGWTKADERKLDLVFDRARRDLARGHARFAAFFSDRVDAPTGADGDVQFLLASLTFSVHTSSDLGTELELSPSVLFAAFATEDAVRGEIRHADVERPRFTDLECGRAVHLRRLYESEAMLPRFDPYFSETYVVPLGVDGSACAILQFVTPCLEYARSFSNTFFRLANTMTLFTENDPTVFNGTAPAPVV